MTNFGAAVDRVKGDVRRAVPATLITRATTALGILGRNRLLTPAVTTHLALHRALHGGMAVTHLRQLAEVSFTPSAYCQAIARLPETFFRLLQILVTDRLRDDRPQDRWNGRRCHRGVTVSDLVQNLSRFPQLRLVGPLAVQFPRREPQPAFYSLALQWVILMLSAATLQRFGQLDEDPTMPIPAWLD
jgi:hypothetical protein